MALATCVWQVCAWDNKRGEVRLETTCQRDHTWCDVNGAVEQITCREVGLVKRGNCSFMLSWKGFGDFFDVCTELSSFVLTIFVNSPFTFKLNSQWCRVWCHCYRWPSCLVEEIHAKYISRFNGCHGRPRGVFFFFFLRWLHLWECSGPQTIQVYRCTKYIHHPVHTEEEVLALLFTSMDRLCSRIHAWPSWWR